MSTGLSIEDFVDNISKITFTSELWSELMAFVKPMGIDALSYYHKAPPGSTDFSEKYFHSIGFDEALAAEHRRNHTIFSGALTSHFMPLLEPVLWNGLLEKVILSAHQIEQLRSFYLAEPANGLVLPVFGPHSRNGCVVLRFTNIDHKICQNNIHKANFAANQCHLQFCRIKASERSNDVKLTAREQEVLTWVARGKSNAVIAEIVGISQHTVNGYLRRVYLKTQTSDRTTAALRAIGDSLIDF